MTDIHVGDVFENEDGKRVRVTLIELDGSLHYEFDASGRKSSAQRDTFLERYPFYVDPNAPEPTE